jgi:putative ABC transport system permease protein
MRDMGDTLMRWVATLPLRLRSLFRRDVVEVELDEELRGHRERLAAEYRFHGMPPEVADAAARRAMPGLEQAKEACRDARHVGLFEELAHDARYAARVLRKSPTFSFVAALTLALGVGVNVTMFTVVDAVVFRTLPFDHPEQLIRVYSTMGGAIRGNPSALDIRDVAAMARGIERLVVYDQWRKNVQFPNGRPQEMVVGLVPGEYFQTLGIRPILGRLFTDDENRFGANHVAAISRRLWRDRYRSAPDVLGRSLLINDESYTIVAVMPDAVPAWLEARHTPTLIWTPFAPDPTTWLESSRGQRGYLAIGRLRPGVTLAAARAELGQLGARLASTYVVDREFGLTAAPLVDMRIGTLRPMLVLLMAAVTSVLLIACANLANLLFARNAARQRELQLRLTLGASRARLCRQLLVETFTLTALGGAGGLALSVALSIMVARLRSPALPQLGDLTIDWRVLAFTLAVSLLTALAFGLGPALTTSRVDLGSALRAGGRSGMGTRAQRRIRSALVVAEVALALVLAAATALLTESARNLQRQNLGFSIEHMLKAHIYIPPARYGDAAAVARFAERFGDAVRALPGVSAATVTIAIPPADSRWVQKVSIDGAPSARAGDESTTYLAVTDRWFLQTLGVPIVRGRNFADSDVPDEPPVAVVNEAFVRRFLNGRNPIGTRIRIGDGTDTAAPRPITIVGVFRDVKNDGLAEPPVPQVVGLHTQLPEFNVEFKDLLVRTVGDPHAVVPAIERTLSSMDPQMPLAEVATFEDVVSAATGERPYVTLLLGAFAVLGLSLAAIGIYGVVAYAVTQRTPELAVRSALGATRSGLLWYVVRDGLALGSSGAAAGIIVSLGASRLFAGQMYGVSALDPLTLGVTALGLITIAAGASLVPAMRATRIDPVRALRGE